MNIYKNVKIRELKVPEIKWTEI